VLQVRAIKRDLVRDAVDDDGVWARPVHLLGAELRVLGHDAPVATIHLLDELRRERPLPTDDETHCRGHGAETARRRRGRQALLETRRLSIPFSLSIGCGGAGTRGKAASWCSPPSTAPSSTTGATST